MMSGEMGGKREEGRKVREKRGGKRGRERRHLVASSDTLQVALKCILPGLNSQSPASSFALTHPFVQPGVPALAAEVRLESHRSRVCGGVRLVAGGGAADRDAHLLLLRTGEARGRRNAG